MNVARLAEAPVPWAAAAPGDPSAPAARALFTRVLAHRNVAGFPFWIACPPDQRERLIARIRDHAAARGLTEETVPADLPADSIGVLRERMLFPEHPLAVPGGREHKRLFTGADPSAHALFGETEHWTAARILPGLATTEEALPILLEEERESREEFQGVPAFSRDSARGILTSDPSLAGAGLRLEAGLHLPGLMAARRIAQAQRALAAMGLELRPLSLRDPAAADAGFFRIVARGGPGLGAVQVWRRFAEKTGALLAADAAAWNAARERDPLALEDRAHRALRLLQEARRIEHAEGAGWVALAREGAYAGHFPGTLLPRLEEFRVRAQPFHATAGAESPSVRRAELARSLLN